MTVLLWFIALFAFVSLARTAFVLTELRHRRQQGLDITFGDLIDNDDKTRKELDFRITVASAALFILISLFTATLAVLVRI